MSTNDGGPAFPCLDVVYPNGYAAQGKPGMSLRDHFAGLAMAQIIANGPEIRYSLVCDSAQIKPKPASPQSTRRLRWLTSQTRLAPITSRAV